MTIARKSTDRGTLETCPGEEGSPSSGSEHGADDFEKLPPIPDKEDSPEACSSTTLPNSATTAKSDRKISNASSLSREQSPLIRSPLVESLNEARRPNPRPHLARQQSRQKLKHQDTQNTKWAQYPSRLLQHCPSRFSTEPLLSQVNNSGVNKQTDSSNPATCS